MNDIDGKEALAIAKGIAMACRFGNLSYDEAKVKCQPYLDIVNRKGKELAKRYKKRFYNFTFTGLTR